MASLQLLVKTPQLPAVLLVQLGLSDIWCWL